MKKIMKFVCALIIAVSAGAYCSHAQVYIKVRPHRPPQVDVRVNAPSPRHVWIEDDWEPRDGRYEYVGGRWAEPPYGGARWVPGHWRHRRHGWVWIPGHWRRR